jgi:hypothetical protein
MPTQEPRIESSSGCLLRIFWMFLGNAALVLVALQILRAGRAFSVMDGVYWLVVVLSLAARYTDIHYFKGTNADGKLSTPDDWRHYALILVLLAGGAWLAVHLLGRVGPLSVG